MVVLWLRSDEHLANILDPGWRDVGIAELTAGGGQEDQTVVWVVEFGWTRAS